MVRVLWRFFFFFFHYHLCDVMARNCSKDERAQLGWTGGEEHLNLKGPKFEVLSRPKKFVVPRSSLRIGRICMRKVFYNSFDYTLATMAPGR